ncbi:MAG: efflux transporter outer membrane subunit [Pseudomonadota bacterium]
MTVLHRARPGLLAVATALALSACASGAPVPMAAPPAPPAWQAPLPHNGSVTDLADWWRQQGDPLLVQLIESAQLVSSSVATAASRIAQSRAERVASGAALLPVVDATAGVSRANGQAPLPPATTAQAGLQTAWEIDLFGANRAYRDAAQARLDSAHAGWHEARVAVAAEVANQYYGLRACQRQLAVTRLDAASRDDSARLTGLSAQAGFQSPANAALARASAADGNNRAIEQNAACERDLKALVALSGAGESALRAKLAGADLVAPAPIAIGALPAAILRQRPDLYRAEREVSAASFEVAGASAQRYPRLSLSGSVGVANLRSGGVNTGLDTWSIGPLALTLPLFDGGRRRADIDAAGARYQAAVVDYRASVRQAVSEVEQALVNLDSSAERAGFAQAALDGYRTAFVATEERYKNGLASLLELEDVRRTRLAAENTVLNLQRERNTAWVALYRAAGGGWRAPTAPQ